MSLKAGPIMLRNILGPVFNLYLDQLLTYKICYFLLFLFIWAETPFFIAFSAKNAKFEETQKRKKTLFVNTIVLTALVNVSVFLHFSFLLFFQFPFFSEMFLIGFPKSRNTKKNKACKTKTRTKGRQKMQNKNK